MVGAVGAVYVRDHPVPAGAVATPPITRSCAVADGLLKVTVPPGSSTGRRLRLRGEGMPNRRGARGNLIAEVAVMVPARLTPRERELFSELANVSTFDPRRELPRSGSDSPRGRKAATS